MLISDGVGDGGVGEEGRVILGDGGGSGGKAEAGSDPTRGVCTVDESGEKDVGKHRKRRDTESLCACLCFLAVWQVGQESQSESGLLPPGPAVPGYSVSAGPVRRFACCRFHTGLKKTKCGGGRRKTLTLLIYLFIYLLSVCLLSC